MTNAEYLFQPTLQHSLDADSNLCRVLVENLPSASNVICIALSPNSEEER